VADTIEDLSCWTRDDIAQNSFGVNYSTATATQRDQVDDVFLNIMSYHYGNFNNLLERLTPGQMDRVAGVANTTRDNVTGNYFRFVDFASPLDNLGGLNTGTAFRTIDGAITGSGNDDVLLIRAGTYNKAVAGSWRITANRVLTSRNGTVRITRTP
jgi:hypothetical protein